MDIEISYYEALPFDWSNWKRFLLWLVKRIRYFLRKKKLCIVCTTSSTPASCPALSCKAPGAYVMSFLNNIFTALPAKKSGHFEAKIALHQYIITEFERCLDAIPKAVSDIHTPEEDFIINGDSGESDWGSDNATTFAYVNNMGVSSSCDRLAKEI